MNAPDAMPCADLVLTCESGRMKRYGVPLDAYDDESQRMADEADRRGWARPFIVAPAPGRPEGETFPPKLTPTTWGQLSTEWAGRRALVLWEGEPLSSPRWRPFHGGGMITRRRGVIVATDDGWRLRTDHGLLGVELLDFPPGAHVTELRP